MRRPTSRVRGEAIVRSKSDCTIIPLKVKRRNPIRQFRTVCVRNCVSSNRTSSHRQSYGGCENTVGVSSTGLLDYGVNVLTTVCTALLVPFTVLCATFFAVIAVLFATFLAVRTGTACTLIAEMAKASMIERNTFIVLKISLLTGRVRLSAGAINRLAVA